MRGEPTIAASLRAGVDVVTFSGDKLLGGPQAGLITGSRELVAKVRKNPLFRALRVDKMFYAALEATLLAYLREDYDSLPALRMMRLTEEQIGERAEHLMRKLHISTSEAQRRGGRDAVGDWRRIGSGGDAAERGRWRCHRRRWARMRLRRSCESGTTPIIARVEEGRVLLDLRTVDPEQDAVIVEALAL